MAYSTATVYLAAILASVAAAQLIPVLYRSTYSTAGLEQLLTDVCLLSRNPGSTLVAVYRLPPLTIGRGEIAVQGERPMFCPCCRVRGERIEAPIYAREDLHLGGMAVLNMTSLNGTVMVEVCGG